MANYSQSFTLNPGDTLTVNVSAPATPQPAPPLSPVRYSARANAGWDAYLLNPPPDMAKVRRVVEYPGWGDQFTGKFACWAYIDALAIYVTLDNGRQFPNPVVAAHPDWILKGADGKFLFLNWRDADGTLQQYAGDPRSGFAGYQAQRCRDAVGKGYKGPWLDDVNMSQNFCDAAGNPVTVMTDAQWRAAMATYTEVLRNAVPGAEVVHNAPWGQTHGLANDPYILRQIAACDFLNIEGGFGDNGIVGGNSSDWSLTNLFHYIDWVHSIGRAVVCEDVKATAEALQDWPYSLACFHCIDDWGLYFSSQNVYPPFPGTLALTLGLPSGPRAYVVDHWERWFSNGAVFVCEPGSAQINIALPTPMYDESGKPQTTLPMGPKSGRIMRKSV